MNIWVAALVGVWLVTPVMGYIVMPYLLYGNKSTRKRIIIMVLGDLGRSPRMCYHALSFAESKMSHGSKKMDVELCGYTETPIPQAILEQDNININKISVIENTRGLPFMLFAPYKIVCQILAIIRILWELRGSDYILLQNPPSVPLLPVVCFYKLFCTFNKTKLIIDWHNFGYTILKMKFNNSDSHPFVKLHYCIEYVFAKFGDYHLTVTHSMKEYLVDTWHLSAKKISVLHDRPGAQFKPVKNTTEKTELIKKSHFINKYFSNRNYDPLTDKLLVTSTSFTPDEDLSILIDSLVQLDKKKSTGYYIHCFITGKGPLKDHYIQKVSELRMENVAIHFVWLSHQDYPLLLQLCDFGVSLHLSSSGLDLPMKILDMFGSGLPVVAYGYPTLTKELVHEGSNGFTFTDVQSCVESVQKMCDPQQYKKMRETVVQESKLKWQQNWENSIVKEFKI